jgi:hypothetical protein
MNNCENCSKNGVCENEECKCKPGWSGVNCLKSSIEQVNTPPKKTSTIKIVIGILVVCILIGGSIIFYDWWKKRNRYTPDHGRDTRSFEYKLPDREPVIRQDTFIDRGLDTRPSDDRGLDTRPSEYKRNRYTPDHGRDTRSFEYKLPNNELSANRPSSPRSSFGFRFY